MEPRFEVTLIPDRKICHEFGAITARKNAATWVLLGCSLVVLLVPVSYTHLDVYKRQPWAACAAPCLTEMW